jgi:hypothetical protein
MLKSKNNFLEMILTFFEIQITEKLFPAFQHLNKFTVHVLCFNSKGMPQNNMPVFLKLYFRKQRKQANYFLIGTTVKLHSAIKLFCLSPNKIIHPLKEVIVFSTSCKLIHVYTSCQGKESVYCLTYKTKK